MHPDSCASLFERLISLDCLMSFHVNLQYKFIRIFSSNNCWANSLAVTITFIQFVQNSKYLHQLRLSSILLEKYKKREETAD